MPITNESSVVDFDADAALAAVREAATGTLYSLAEYDSQEFEMLYVDDATQAFYEDEAEMLAHFDRIHSHVNLDFTEMELFTESLFPVADRVRYITTELDYLKLVRLYHGREGLFLAVEPEEPVVPVADAVEAVLE